MSRFFTDRYSNLVPYTPGEQPQDMKYVKLNTNESPFPPSPGVLKAVEDQCSKLQLYSDPQCFELRKAMAAVYGVDQDEVVMVNGSDESLNFAFMAFADEKTPLACPSISYGFYPVFAQLNHIPYVEIPLDENLQINPDDYMGLGKTICIANPNAPTGQFIPLEKIEEIVKSNPDNVVIIDEAYIAFGGQSAIPLTKKYSNLLVTGTFSKSHSLAGGRLGYAIGNKDLVSDINTIRYSTNPYNVNRMTSAAGVAALAENNYYLDNCRTIVKNRAWTTDQLKALGFTVLDSKANFVFAKTEAIDGKELYLQLKKRGVLVRHFDKQEICQYNRITIGTASQMEKFINTVKEILNDKAEGRI